MRRARVSVETDEEGWSLGQRRWVPLDGAACAEHAHLFSADPSIRAVVSVLQATVLRHPFEVRSARGGVVKMSAAFRHRIDSLYAGGFCKEVLNSMLKWGIIVIGFATGKGDAVEHSSGREGNAALSIENKTLHPFVHQLAVTADVQVRQGDSVPEYRVFSRTGDPVTKRKPLRNVIVMAWEDVMADGTIRSPLGSLRSLLRMHELVVFSLARAVQRRANPAVYLSPPREEEDVGLNAGTLNSAIGVRSDYTAANERVQGTLSREALDAIAADQYTPVGEAGGPADGYADGSSGCVRHLAERAGPNDVVPRQLNTDDDHRRPVIRVPPGYTVHSLPMAAQPSDLGEVTRHRDQQIAESFGVPQEFWAPHASTAANASAAASSIFARTRNTYSRAVAAALSVVMHELTFISELTAEDDTGDNPETRPVVTFPHEVDRETLEYLVEQGAITPEAWVAAMHLRTGIPEADLRAPASLREPAPLRERAPPARADGPAAKRRRADAKETEEAHDDD